MASHTSLDIHDTEDNDIKDITMNIAKVFKAQRTNKTLHTKQYIVKSKFPLNG
jgi:hypothetical protein